MTRTATARDLFNSREFRQGKNRASDGVPYYATLLNCADGPAEFQTLIRRRGPARDMGPLP
jgi:hypothetical protein